MGRGGSLQASPTLSLSYPNPRPAHQRQGLGVEGWDSRQASPTLSQNCPNPRPAPPRDKTWTGAAFRLHTHSLRCIITPDLHTRDRAPGDGESNLQASPTLSHVCINSVPARQREGLWGGGAAFRLRPHSLRLSPLPDLRTRDKAGEGGLSASPTLSHIYHNPRPKPQRQGWGEGEQPL